MRKLAVLLIFALLTASFAPILTAPPPIAAQDGPTVYSDPAGQFNVTIPAGWTDVSTPELAQFDNGAGLTAAFVVLPADDLETGRPLLLEAFGAAPDLEPISSNTAALPSGIWTQYIYSIGEDLGVLVALYANSSVYGMWFFGSETAVNTGEADLVNIAISYGLGTVIDLTGQVARDLTEADFAAIGEYATSALEAFHVPGSAVAIVQNGQIVYASGYGVLDVESNTPVTADSLFMIGSVTKSMTSFLAATLVDEGKLDWDQPATDILPEFALSDPAATPEIRVRDLFNMTSGAPGSDIRMFMDALTPAQIVEFFQTVELLGPPHTVYHYNNYMVALGGYMLALVNGATLDEAPAAYNDLLQNRLFTPLGMTSTTVDFDAALANPNHAVPHAYDPLTDTNPLIPLDWERFAVPVAPAGAVWSSVNDMAQYLMMQLARGVAPDGTRVVSDENLTETQTAAVNPDGEPFDYAMGWLPESYHGQQLVWHNGGTLGFSTYCGFLPDANLGIIVLSNRSGAENYYFAMRDFVLETAFDLPHDSSATYADSEAQVWQAAAEQLEGLTVLPVDAAAVEAYLGEYETGLRVEMRDDALWFSGDFMEGQIAPLPEGEPGQFIVVNSAVLTGLEVNFIEVDGQSAVQIGSEASIGSVEVYLKQ
ncbi:MAG: beta-lactamase family protein [Anaerolineae bacterium]|nr:beta-lactamase family protein [Anaerolineae bacterium]